MTSNNVGKATTLQDCEACICMTLTELETWNTANDDILGKLEAFVQISGLDTTAATVVAVYTSYSDQPEGDMVYIDGWLLVDPADITGDWITEQVTATEATRMAKMPHKSDDDAEARNGYAHEIVNRILNDHGIEDQDNVGGLMDAVSEIEGWTVPPKKYRSIDDPWKADK